MDMNIPKDLFHLTSSKNTAFSGKTQRASDTNNHKNNGRNQCELYSLENLFSRECLKLDRLKTWA